MFDEMTVRHTPDFVAHHSQLGADTGHQRHFQLDRCRARPDDGCATIFLAAPYQDRVCPVREAWDLSFSSESGATGCRRC
jgi:hypothetical protein